MYRVPNTGLTGSNLPLPAQKPGKTLVLASGHLPRPLVLSAHGKETSEGGGARLQPPLVHPQGSHAPEFSTVTQRPENFGAGAPPAAVQQEKLPAEGPSPRSGNDLKGTEEDPYIQPVMGSEGDLGEIRPLRQDVVECYMHFLHALLPNVPVSTDGRYGQWYFSVDADSASSIVPPAVTEERLWCWVAGTSVQRGSVAATWPRPRCAAKKEGAPPPQAGGGMREVQGCIGPAVRCFLSQNVRPGRPLPHTSSFACWCSSMLLGGL